MDRENKVPFLKVFNINGFLANYKQNINLLYEQVGRGIEIHKKFIKILR